MGLFCVVCGVAPDRDAVRLSCSLPQCEGTALHVDCARAVYTNYVARHSASAARRGEENRVKRNSFVALPCMHGARRAGASPRCPGSVSGQVRFEPDPEPPTPPARAPTRAAPAARHAKKSAAPSDATAIRILVRCVPGEGAHRTVSASDLLPPTPAEASADTPEEVPPPWSPFSGLEFRAASDAGSLFSYRFFHSHEWPRVSVS